MVHTWPFLLLCCIALSKISYHTIHDIILVSRENIQAQGSRTDRIESPDPIPSGNSCPTKDNVYISPISPTKFC